MYSDWGRSEGFTHFRKNCILGDKSRVWRMFIYELYLLWCKYPYLYLMCLKIKTYPGMSSCLVLPLLMMETRLGQVSAPMPVQSLGFHLPEYLDLIWNRFPSFSAFIALGFRLSGDRDWTEDKILSVYVGLGLPPIRWWKSNRGQTSVLRVYKA